MTRSNIQNNNQANDHTQAPAPRILASAVYFADGLQPATFLGSHPVAFCCHTDEPGGGRNGDILTEDICIQLL